MKHTLSISAILGAAALILSIGTSALAGMKEKEQNVSTQENTQLLLRDIYFAGGCFWGVQKYLDAIPGVGEKRRNDLIQAFKTVKAIKNAELEQLRLVVPKNTAQAVYDYFHSEEKDLCE